jgi:hypothetical protein
MTGAFEGGKGGRCLEVGVHVFDEWIDLFFVLDVQHISCDADRETAFEPGTPPRQAIDPCWYSSASSKNARHE